MGFEFLLWTIRAWMQRTPCTCNFMCIKDVVIKIDFHCKSCPHFLMTWAWLSCSFHLVKLISQLLFILRHAMALVVIVERCFDCEDETKKVDFWRKYEKKKRWILEKILYFSWVFSPRGGTSPLLMSSGLLLPAGATNTNCFGEHDWLWHWTLQPFMGAASRAHRNLYPCRETGIFLGDRSNKAQGGKWARSAVICSILSRARQECREVPSSLSQRQVMAFLGIWGWWLCFMGVRFIFLFISLAQEGMMLLLKITCSIGLFIIILP